VTDVDVSSSTVTDAGEVASSEGREAPDVSPCQVTQALLAAPSEVQEGLKLRGEC